MGLEEKRFLKELKETVMPKIQEDIIQSCGRDIEWEIDWNSFSENMRAMKFFENQGLKRVTGAIRGLCRDEAVKAAVIGDVKKFVIKNFDEIDKAEVTFREGILTVHAAWGTGKYPELDQIKKAMEGDSGLKLADKRFARDMEEKAIPKYKNKLDEALNKPVEWEIDYSGFSGEERGQRFFENQGPKRVADAIRTVAKDKIGKEALEESLAKVIMRNVKGLKKAEYRLESGVLIVDGDYGASVYPDEKSIVLYLENEL